jgi:hypothetical protein
VVERMNQTLVEKSRCMIFDEKLSRGFWAEAIATEAYMHVPKEKEKSWMKNPKSVCSLDMESLLESRDISYGFHMSTRVLIVKMSSLEKRNLEKLNNKRSNLMKELCYKEWWRIKFHH